ncbi:MAG TPA: FAD-dependent monooxygenase [Steroidobacteraceae bacterium]|nr:FAD-dependent monooxygenase [Steroidobacteraceae bacterium]
MKRDFDVVVVGGAMAGAGAAALLAATRATSGLRVALVEPRPIAAPAPGDPLDIRVSALSRASQRLLEVTGAWPAVAARAAAYGRMVIWEERQAPDAPDALVFDAAELGEPDLGHIGENRAIQSALTVRAEALGVVLLRAELAAFDPARDAVRVALGDGREFRAGLVVGADGAESGVRRSAGIDTRGREYGQRAVVAHLEPAKPHQATAWQRFLDTGPLALLPLADGRVSLVWSTVPAAAQSLVDCPEPEFAERVTAASDGVLGALRPTTPRASFPLRLLHARRYAAERIALVGDAAHVVHPLAGQGINLAFLDAAALVDIVGSAVAAGDDPGELAVLRRYERWRKAEALPAIALLDGIQRLYFGGNPLQSRLRRGLLGLAQASGTAKRLLMGRALGVAGVVPEPVRRPPS